MSRNFSHSRYAHQVSFSFLVCMVLFAVVLAAGGVTYSVFKHKQVTVRTEINKIHHEIAEHKMNTNQYLAKANARTNRWVMRDLLNQNGSTLQDIERSQIEVARRLNREAVARVSIQH